MLDCLWACGRVSERAEMKREKQSCETVSERAKTAWDSNESEGGGER